jgi:hypothetical protein
LAADLVEALLALAVPDWVDFLLLFLCFFTVEALLGVCAFGVAGALGAGVDCANMAAAVSSEVKIKRFIVSFLLKCGVLPATHEPIMLPIPRRGDHPRVG